MVRQIGFLFLFKIIQGHEFKIQPDFDLLRFSSKIKFKYFTVYLFQIYKNQIFKNIQSPQKRSLKLTCSPFQKQFKFLSQTTKKKLHKLISHKKCQNPKKKVTFLICVSEHAYLKWFLKTFQKNAIFLKIFAIVCLQEVKAILVVIKIHHLRA